MATLVTAAAFFAFGAQGIEAAGKPAIMWTDTVLPMSDYHPFLEQPGMQSRISRALTARLRTLSAEGKLPFVLQEGSTDLGSIRSVTNLDTPIALIPLVTLDTSFDTHYSITGQDYYRSIIFSGLSLAICSADEESNSWRILAMIPANSYIVEGADLSHLRTTPFSEQEKARIYADVTERMIASMEVNLASRVLRNIEMKALDSGAETYQVTSVEVGSPRAREAYGSNLPFIQNMIGNFYTTKYQNVTGRIVYPPRGEGVWKKDVSSGLYATQISTPTGSIRLSMEAPKHEIALNLSGVAKGEIATKKESDVKRDMMYKVWLKKSPIEGREKGEATRVTDPPVREYKVGDVYIEYKEADLYTQLLIDASYDLAQQSKGNK